MIHQVALHPLEERGGLDGRVGEPVDGLSGGVHAEVAVVPVGGDGAADIHHLAEREEHGLELLVVDQPGLGVVEPHRHAGDQGGLPLGAPRVAANLGQPGGGDVGEAHRHAGRDLRHHRGRVAVDVGSGSGCRRRRRCLGGGGGRRGDGLRRGRRQHGRARGRRRRWCRRRHGGTLLGGHQRGDLVTRQRAAQVAHRPAGGEHLGLVLAGPAQHEFALAEAADRVAHGTHVHAAGGRAHPVQQALLVAVGLQAADHPCAGVGQGLVVHVHGVLGAEHHAHAERPCLLHQRHDRLLGGRGGGRRQVAGHLVHVQQGAQVGGAALAAHPGDQLGQHQRGDELALLVAEVGGGDDGAAGAAVRRAQHGADVQRDAEHPRPERRRGEQPVEAHGERQAVLRREELVRLEHTQLADRRVHHHADQRRQVQVAAGFPLVVDEVAEEDVLPAGQRVGVDADQAEQAADEALDLVARGLRVGASGRGGERADDVQADAAVGPGRVDGEVGGGAQGGDAVRADAPTGEPLRPQLRLGGRELGDGLAVLRGVALVHPRLEVRRGEGREREAQVGEVALRVDQEGRHAGIEGLLDEHDPEAGLAGPGHADDDPVGGEVAAGQRHVGVRALVCSRVDQPAEEEVSHAGDVSGATPALASGLGTHPGGLSRRCSCPPAMAAR